METKTAAIIRDRDDKVYNLVAILLRLDDRKNKIPLEKVVGREGFEPSTNWLKANCSTN